MDNYITHHINGQSVSYLFVISSQRNNIVITFIFYLCISQGKAYGFDSAYLYINLNMNF